MVLLPDCSGVPGKDARFLLRPREPGPRPRPPRGIRNLGHRRLRPLPPNGTCGVHSVDTKSEIVKILHFKQFYKHYVFVEDREGGRKKVLKNYMDVNVCIDMVCGDTKTVFESEE